MLAMIVSGWPQWLSATGSRGCAQHPRDPGLVVPLREQCWGPPDRATLATTPCLLPTSVWSAWVLPHRAFYVSVPGFCVWRANFHPNPSSIPSHIPTGFLGAMGSRALAEAPPAWMLCTPQPHPPGSWGLPRGTHLGQDLLPAARQGSSWDPELCRAPAAPILEPRIVGRRRVLPPRPP